MSATFFKIGLFLACFFNVLSAEIADFFKPCPNKTEASHIRNIDFIYMINLDQRPEKFERSAEQLSLYGVYPYRFSAVNGWELTLEAINELGIKYEPWMSGDVMGTSYLISDEGKPTHGMINTEGRTYFCHCMGQGAIGIVLSHLSILQDAFDSGYETIWVMEDDIQVIKNPNLISDLVEELDHTVGKEGWDILFTDQDTKSNQGNRVPCLSFARRPNFNPWNPSRFTQRQNVSSTFRKVGARYGAYSMIVRRSGMEKILNFIKVYRVFLPYDLEYYLPDNIRLYTVIDDVLSTQINALSDNGAPNYKHKNH
jgi:GR25 family glycosyltransferase involved in LPS biosynthesis